MSSLTSSNQDLTTANEAAAAQISELQGLAATLNSTISELLETIEELEESPPPEVNWSSTLDLVMERGTLKCGVKGG